MAGRTISAQHLRGTRRCFAERKCVLAGLLASRRLCTVRATCAPSCAPGACRARPCANLVWAFVYNVLGVPVAGVVLCPVFGLLLSPMIASAAMSLSSVS